MELPAVAPAQVVPDAAAAAPPPPRQRVAAGEEGDVLRAFADSANRHGIGGSVSAEDRWATLDAAMTQRQAEYEGAAPEYTSGAPDEIDETSDPVSKEFYDFYRTPRGYSPRTTTKPTLSSNIGFMNFYPFTRLDEISPRPVMFVAGTEAHSIEFSHDAYARAAEPKELVEVPGAGHVDLYDREELIPFDKLLSFFGKL